MLPENWEFLLLCTFQAYGTCLLYTSLALRNKELLVTIFKLNKKDKEYTGISDKEKAAMIVTEGGKKLVGREIEILITGILKTPAGRMIFSKAANGCLLYTSRCV